MNSLTARQIAILEHIRDGNPNKLIARSMGITTNTLKNQLTTIYKVLKARDRTQAVVEAIHLGWLDLWPETSDVQAIAPDEPTPYTVPEQRCLLPQPHSPQRCSPLYSQE
jgi:DNA-binding CsgD family transcriptional regulator